MLYFAVNDLGGLYVYVQKSCNEVGDNASVKHRVVLINHDINGTSFFHDSSSIERQI